MSQSKIISRTQFTLRGLLITVAIFVLVLAVVRMTIPVVIGALSTSRYHPIPPVAQIIEVKAQFSTGQGDDYVKFDVPHEHWEPVLSALRPATVDPQPASWEILGELEVTTDSGKHVFVDLYSTPQGPGAFSLGSNLYYYRGGSTRQLISALRNAYAARKATE